jgi:hypothetical protein
MDSFYRGLVTTAFWLGLAAFVLALIMTVVGKPFLFGLTPGGINRAAQTLFLIAVATYCVRRTGQAT